MLRIVLTVTFALALGGVASAADFPLPARAPTPPAAYYPAIPRVSNWGGFYGGLNGGYGFGTSRWTDQQNFGGNSNVPLVTTGDFSLKGGLFGGTFGANFQADAIVLGFETDFDWAGIKGSITPANRFCTLATDPNANGAGSTCNTRLDWFGTGRLRIGYAVDRVLLFASGGAAFGSLQAGLTGAGSSKHGPAPGTFQDTTTAGWTVGAGIEVAITENLSAKAEYLFVNLGTVPCTKQASCGIDSIGIFSGVNVANDAVKFTANLVRFGVNYRFGLW
jgi:outer membrane immunogenic protein